VKEIKQKIKSEYNEIVDLNEREGAEIQKSYVCPGIFDPIRDTYKIFSGYHNEADFGLGCGFPFQHANIQKGHTVVDLGCAAGIDSFITAALVGPKGRLIGIDITPKLIAKAKEIALKYKVNQAEFHCADIEKLPLADQMADAVISNGVFSLLPDLDKAFANAFRILKKDGIFCISDIARKQNFDIETYEKVKKYTGCLNGIRQVETYLDRMKNVGFDVKIVKERPVAMPTDLEAGGVVILTLKLSK